jgi:hypothetical protein
MPAVNETVQSRKCFLAIRLTYPFWQCNKHSNCGCDYIYNVKSQHSFWAAREFEFMRYFYFKIELRVTWKRTSTSRRARLSMNESAC